MINYVIINGVNSNTKNGLMINELPPISKPQMRSNIEEIDGRDGDIITKLGYSAYDKTITIGLWGTSYDVNDIIAFFNKEGTITFSNEPDKYYKFTMLEQIDIERLLKFKTASITFHCQPFKYPTEETPIEIEYEYVEQDNVESANMTNTEGDTFLKIDLKGNTSQTGTPTPDTPIPINVVSGDNTIEVCGKNLFNKNAITTNSLLNSSTGEAEYNGNNNVFTTEYISVIKDTTYSSNFVGVVRRCLYDKNKNFVSSIASSEQFTPNIDGYIRQSYNSADKDGIQIVVGNTLPQTIEPYQSQTYHINLGTLELCKIGDYQDYFTKNSDGQWCKYNAIKKDIFNGTENWTMGNATGGKYFMTPLTYTARDYMLCNMFILDNNASSTGTLNAFYCGAGNIFFVRPVFNGTEITDVDSWKTAIGNKNVIVDRVEPSPYLSLIENETLISQLDNIEKAMSYEGTTNIGQVNNDKAFLMNLKAMKKDTNEVVVNNIGNTYSKPTIALEGTGDINIYLNGTQMLKATLTDKMTIDTTNLEAYNPDTMTLLNRQLVGDISKFKLDSGNNTIKMDGNLTTATITDYTRWL